MRSQRLIEDHEGERGRHERLGHPEQRGRARRASPESGNKAEKRKPTAQHAKKRDETGIGWI